MHLAEKEFIKRLRTMFATLFARSMTKVIVNCPGLASNTYIYSNIPLEDMEFFEADAKYYLHEVEITDTEFFEDLLEVFPVFKNSIFMLYTDKFLSSVGKHAGKLSEIKLDFRGQSLIISVLSKEGELEVECGELISEHTASQYKRVFDGSKLDPIVSKVQNLIGKIDLVAPYTMIDIAELPGGRCKCALLANGSGVSMKEFPNKADLFDYSFELMSNIEGGSVRVNCIFNCPLVKVVSVQPAVVWYIKSKTKDINNGE